MKITSSVLAIVACGAFLPASAAEPEPPQLPLWKGNPPGMVAGGATQGADDGTGRWWNVGVPGMLVYLPDKPAPEGGRVALIACPGGGYTHLTRLEGADGAVKAFLPDNVAIISLKYRTAPPSTDIEKDALEDGKRAVRLVRHHAREWGIHPQKIGMVGWSAGANLVLNVASRFDTGTSDAEDPVSRVSSRPDFVVLLSPWPAKKASTDYPIPNNAPPAFIGTAEDDKTAPSSFAKGIGAAYQESGGKHHLWVLETGGHGVFTIGAPGDGGKWIERLWPWLGQIGIQR